MNELNAMIQHNSLDFFVSKKSSGDQQVNENDPQKESEDDDLKSASNVYVKFYEISNKSTKRLTPANIDDMIDEYFFIREILLPHDDFLLLHKMIQMTYYLI